MLRRIFRQDPDIIVIGEVRDIQTAELAVRADLTGHLVFATLHTNNAVEAIYRLQDMGIPSYIVSAVLRKVVAQRLSRKICKKCNLQGCAHCNNTVYYGRTVVAEILSILQELSILISEKASHKELEKYLIKTKFTSLIEDARHKKDSGVISVTEINREI